MIVNLLIEGYLDEAIGRKLINAAGHVDGLAFGRKGWTYIEQKIRAFDQSCNFVGLLTLVDFMDTRLECAPSVVNKWLPNRNRNHIFRVVVREIEAWVLADRENCASFLYVPVVKVPLDPEGEDDPKRTSINLARSSRNRSIRDSLVPTIGLSASEGPLYSSELIRFVTEKWDPQEARKNSNSLDRCLVRLSELR